MQRRNLSSLSLVKSTATEIKPHSSYDKSKKRILLNNTGSSCSQLSRKCKPAYRTIDRDLCFIRKQKIQILEAKEQYSNHKSDEISPKSVLTYHATEKCCREKDSKIRLKY